MKEMNDFEGSIFACVPSTVHLVACFLDRFFKIHPKALHILVTQVLIQLEDRKYGI